MKYILYFNRDDYIEPEQAKRDILENLKRSLNAEIIVLDRKGPLEIQALPEPGDFVKHPDLLVETNNPICKCGDNCECK